MSEQGLNVLIGQIDKLILQHLNYLNNLEKACRTKTEFVHKQPTECNFGQILYADVWPTKESLPQEIKATIEEIESDHRKFHELAGKVNSLNPINETIDATTACQLILKLYKLEEQTKAVK